jgi:outer membrane autotransporter protein
MGSLATKQKVLAGCALLLIASVIPSQGQGACIANGVSIPDTQNIPDNIAIDCTGETPGFIGNGTQTNVVVNVSAEARLSSNGATIRLIAPTINNYGTVQGPWLVAAYGASGTSTRINNYGVMEVSSSPFLWAINTNPALILKNLGRITSHSLPAVSMGGVDPNLSSKIYNEGIIEGVNGVIVQAGSQPTSVINAGILRNLAETATAPAVLFGSANDTLEIHSGSSISGVVDGNAGDTDKLILGGTIDGTFDASTIGSEAQFRNFEQLRKTGASSWSLTGTSGFTGKTIVEAGHLAVNGSLAHSVVTITGGSLGGTGTVKEIVAENGGTVAPGSASIGTLNVAGDVSFHIGSTYRVDTNIAGQSDRIAAAGKADLEGGTVEILAENGSYQPAITYTILTADGGLINTFAGVASNFAYLDPSLSYGSHDVRLTLTRKTMPTDPTDLPTTPTDPTDPADPTDPIDPGESTPQPVAFNSVALSRNQYRVADAVEALGTGNRLYDAVIGQSVSGARHAFEALSGEAHASRNAAAIGQASLVQTALGSRLRQPLIGSSMPLMAQGIYAADKADMAVQPVVVPVLNAVRPYTLWGEGFGTWGKVDGNGNAAALDSSTGGFVLGAETRLSTTSTFFGIAGGFSRTSFDVDARLSSGSTDSIFAALYGSTAWGNLSLRLGASYAWNDIDVSRTIGFPGFADGTHASYDGWTALAFAELGYEVDMGSVQSEPFVGVSLLRLHADGFQEEGGPAALTGYAQDQDLSTTIVGVRVEAGLREDLPLTVRGLLGWRHSYGDVAPEMQLAFAGGESPFTVQGTPVDRDALVAQAGLDWQASDAISLGIAYSGQVGWRAQEHSVKGSFAWRFGTH